MAFQEYRVPNISRYLLPQDSAVTCWAACAASLISVKRGRLLLETDALPAAYRAWYTTPRTVSLDEIKRAYSAMNFTEGRIDLSSRPAFANFIRAHAPIVVASSIVTFGTSVQHVGYHVRVITGFWGDPDSTSEDALQIRIFDPWPPPGFRVETEFLYSHFRYQMELRTGPVPQIVGTTWYLP
jgi:hypothetical protein